MKYFVYILKCRDTSLYIGTTNDLKKRLIAHNTLRSGAHYTKTRRPVVLVHSENCKTKSHALKREHALKKLTRKEKLNLIRSAKPSRKFARPRTSGKGGDGNHKK